MSGAGWNGRIPLVWATRYEDHERIALARLRLLRGRTAEQVERTHAAALVAAVPAESRASMQLRDRAYLEALLAELERHELPSVESAYHPGFSSLGGEHALAGAA